MVLSAAGRLAQARRGAQQVGAVSVVAIGEQCQEISLSPLGRESVLNRESFLVFLLCRTSGEEPPSLNHAALLHAAGGCHIPAGELVKAQCVEGPLGEPVHKRTSGRASHRRLSLTEAGTFKTWLT